MTPKTQSVRQPVAIIGMGGMFAGSKNVKAYWRTLFNGIDRITEPPETHRQLNDCYDSDPKRPDHIYCNRGGFLPTVSFDPTEFGIPPAALEATDTSQLLSLVAAKMALADAGYGGEREFDREHTSVILGVTGTQELVISLGSRMGHPFWRKALENKGLSEQQKISIIDDISSSYVPWQENSFPGLLGNVVAGRICNRLNLGGTNCVVDAACASSLSALHLGLMELYAEKSKMVITGGVDTINDIFMHMCFSKTGVLSHRGDARPFSAEADGTVLGEGIGILVLKRLADAEQDGDRIYAVIRGVGSSSDGKSQSIYAPRPEGQARAMFEAYQNAGISPETVELVEAHGTGTRVGDEMEFTALKTVFGTVNPNGNRCALGSVKSMIGHTKAAAGAAGLIKSALSLYNKILPPTLKADHPDPKLEIQSSPFYLNTSLRPWFSKPDHPRRGGVSSFGFGGSNFHVVLEEYQREKMEIAWDGSVEILAFSGPDAATVTDRLQQIDLGLTDSDDQSLLSRMAGVLRANFSAGHSHRLVMVIDTALDAKERHGRFRSAIDLVAGGQSTVLTAQGIYYATATQSKGKIAFMFPGQGSQYPNMGRDLTCCFPGAMAAIEAADGRIDHTISLGEILYPRPALSDHQQQQQADALRRTDVAQPAIGAISLAMLSVLDDFNLRPDATCGHSYGELPALYAAGWIDRETLLNLSVTRGRLMAEAGKIGDTGTMLAVKAPINALQTLVEQLPDVVLANINSPNQGVLSGTTQAIESAKAACAQKGYRAIALPVAAAFHSPLVQGAGAPFCRAVKKATFTPTQIPVYANVTAAPYPTDMSQAADLLGRQLTSPVRFQDTVEGLYDNGVRTFVEVGPKSVLSGLVRSTLKGRDVTIISLDRSSGKASGIMDLAHTIGHLAALGADLDLNRWETEPPAPREQKMIIPLSGANYRTPRKIDPAPKADRTPSVFSTKKMDHSPTPMDTRKPMNKTLPTAPSENPVARPEKMNPTAGANMNETLAIVQKGLESIQSLQQQTARAHQTFLETQAQAGRTLQEMMKSTRLFVGSALGISLPSATEIQAPVADPVATQPRSMEIPSTAVAVTTTPVATARPIERPVASAVLHPIEPVPEKNRPAMVAETISNTLIAIVSELTGYPEEMLGLEMDIEADLGIDSIKRVEILSAMETRLPHLPQVTPEMVGTLKTLGQICDYLSGGDRKPATNAEDDFLPQLTKARADSSKTIPRQIIDVVESPKNPGRPLRIEAGRWIGVLTNDAVTAQSIISQLEGKHIAGRAISPHGVDTKAYFSGAAGLIIWGSIDPETAFLAAKHAAPTLFSAAANGDALFSVVTGMDGAFGFTGNDFNDPEQGALAGLVKTAALEWESVICRVIDLSPDFSDPDTAARRVVTELMTVCDHDPVEIGLRPDHRVALKPVPAQCVDGPISLDEDDLVVVTGGARGVTAACVLALARDTGVSIALIGRSATPFTVPAWLQDVDGEAAMKKAIAAHAFNGTIPTPKALEATYRKQAANRSILETMDALEASGVNAGYFSADVIDCDSLNAAVNAIRNQMGPITGLIHGAGVLHDRFIVDKTVEQFRQVYATKVQGLKNLIAATEADSIRHLVLFSSVSARTGNTGQSDYAMANEALNKIARTESLRRPGCRVTAINWGPWDGGMVTPTLKKAFDDKAIELIPIETGARLMMAEMQNGEPGSVEVLVGSMLPTELDKLAVTPDDPMVFLERRELDLHRYPVLASHIIGGKPVVPVALITEWIGHGALKENPGFSLHGIDDFRLLSGIRIEQEQKLVRLMVGKAKKTGDSWHVDVELRNGVKNGRDVIHSRARALLVDRFPAPPVFIGNGKNGGRAYPRNLDAIYDDILFHGDHLRAIKSIDEYSDHDMTARLNSAPKPEVWMQDPIQGKWMADPMILDGAFQMAIVWSFEQTGKVCLPSYVRAYRQYRPAFPVSGVTVAMAVTTHSHRKMIADFTFLDDDRQVVATLTGYEATIDESLMHAFKNNRLSPVIKQNKR